MLEDGDAAICIKGISANADGDLHIGRAIAVPSGTRLRKDHPLVKEFPDNFIPVVGPGRTPENSVLALIDWAEPRRDKDREFIQETDPMLRMRNGDFKQFVLWRKGTWVDRNRPEVRQYPSLFERL